MGLLRCVDGLGCNSYFLFSNFVRFKICAPARHVLLLLVFKESLAMLSKWYFNTDIMPKRQGSAVYIFMMKEELGGA